jgi:hypothetical protein
MATSSGSAGYHAPFLRSLVAKDLSDKAREARRRTHRSRDGLSRFLHVLTCLPLSLILLKDKAVHALDHSLLLQAPPAVYQKTHLI